MASLLNFIHKGTSIVTGYRPKKKTIFAAANYSISNEKDIFNNLSPVQFHLWWCQVYRHRGLE